MTLDEFEAIRLADLEGLYQEQAAGRMGVSRPTFSRIIDAAHRKVAEVLTHGKRLRIEAGPVVLERQGMSWCPRCDKEWDGTSKCPCCRNRAIQRAEVHEPAPHKACRHGRHGSGSRSSSTGCTAHPRERTSR
jgi:hypothetical protein